MLLRTLKEGDLITVGEVKIQVKSATEQNLRIAIFAPREQEIIHDKSTTRRVMKTSDNAAVPDIS